MVLSAMALVQKIVLRVHTLSGMVFVWMTVITQPNLYTALCRMAVWNVSDVIPNALMKRVVAVVGQIIVEAAKTGRMLMLKENVSVGVTHYQSK